MATRRLLFSALCFVALVLWAAPAPAQDSAAAKPPATDQLLLSGTVSEKGALLLCSANQKLYHVLNSELLRHLEGQLVTLKARYLPGKDQLYVIAVRADSASHDKSFHLDDAAFRR
jgi:hypothetical protein